MPIFRNLFASLKKKFLKRLSKSKTKKSSRRIRKKIKPLHRRGKPAKKSPARKSRTVPKIKTKKKITKARAKSALKPAKKVAENPPIGEITHYFSHIKVCVIKVLGGDVRVGDRLKIVGHTSNFIQEVTSLQIENTDVKIASKGQLAGLKVKARTRAGDKVYKIN